MSHIIAKVWQHIKGLHSSKLNFLPDLKLFSKHITKYDHKILRNHAQSGFTLGSKTEETKKLSNPNGCEKNNEPEYNNLLLKYAT